MGLRLLPDSFDNQQRGHPLALWLFYLATIVTVGRSLAHIFLADGGAREEVESLLELSDLTGSRADYFLSRPQAVRVLIGLKEELASFLLDGAENGKGTSLCAYNGDTIEKRMKSLLGLWNGMVEER